MKTSSVKEKFFHFNFTENKLSTDVKKYFEIKQNRYNTELGL